MNHDEAAKQKAYYADMASGALGAGEPQEENLDITVIEVLRDSKYRIEGMGRRIDFLQPKADAFDALLAITRAGDRYGNSGLMATEGYGDTYMIDRTLEKIDQHMRNVAEQQREEFIRSHLADAPDADGIADEDLPSHFYEGVEAEPTIPTRTFDPEYFREILRAAVFPSDERAAMPKTATDWMGAEIENMCIGGYEISYDPKNRKVALDSEGHGLVFDEDDFAARLEEIYEDEIDDRNEEANERAAMPGIVPGEGYTLIPNGMAAEIQKRLDRLYELENPSKVPAAKSAEPLRATLTTASADLAGTQQKPWTPPVIDTGDGDDNA